MHLRSSHYQFEMKEVLEHIDSLLKLERRQKDVDELLRAVAYYTAAVCEQERQHMPLVGPSVDRRTLTFVCKLAGSDSLCALICFGCAQLHTSVKSWETFGRLSEHRGKLWSNSDIRMLRVSDTLLHLERKDPKLFVQSFSYEVTVRHTQCLSHFRSSSWANFSTYYVVARRGISTQHVHQ
jgi:hypothetical protein